MHLNPEELVDIAEGNRPETSAPHLASCDACRRQLAGLREMMSVAADVDVPEPSPLFWDHFSRRLNDAIAAEPAGGGWLSLWARVRMPIVLAAAAAVLVIGVLTTRLMAPQPNPTGAQVAAALPPVPAAPAPREGLATDDPSFMVVADLSGPVDVDMAHEAGLTSTGSAEHAVTHMTEGELRELQRLLQEELANSGD